MDVISTLQLRHNRRGRRLAAPLVCLALGTLVLSGCGSARQTFGLDRTPPDEFSVLTRAPLAVPPEYKLRPPDARRSAPAGIGYPPAGGIRRVRLGPADPPAGGGLQRRPSQAASRRSSIRPAPPRSSRASAPPSTGTRPRRRPRTPASSTACCSGRSRTRPAPSSTREQEQQRLRENAALGKPVTEGDTPVIERRRKAPLEGLFN